MGILFCNATSKVHAGHPYSATARVIIVRGLYLVLIEMLEFLQQLLRFIKDAVVIANRLRTSSDHFPSAVNLLPKYLNESTVSRSLPTTCML